MSPGEAVVEVCSTHPATRGRKDIRAAVEIANKAWSQADDRAICGSTADVDDQRLGLTVKALLESQCSRDGLEIEINGIETSEHGCPLHGINRLGVCSL